MTTDTGGARRPDDSLQTMEVTILGHGSLMSGRGLAFSGTFAVRRAGIVALADCRRGFAKLSMYGNRFATDVELSRLPLRGRRVSPPTGRADGTETLALSVSLDDGYRLMKREGYQPDAARQLVRLGRRQGLGLADFLWQVQTQAGHDAVGYRRRLFELTGYTSPHYIPHPVRIDGDETALIFVAPGFEATGSEAVISVRQQTGVRGLMSAGRAWQRKPNDEQLSYMVSCVLGGVHGLKIDDLLPRSGDETRLITALRERVRPEITVEPSRFRETVGLSAEQYGRAFGEPAQLLRRSGLHDFVAGNLSPPA